MEHCVDVDWPASYTYSALQYRRGYSGPDSWMGSLIFNQRDASGLYYRRNRYYDSDKGRFNQEDPIGLAGGVNVYGFAKGDPTTYSDFEGLCVPMPDCLSGTGSLEQEWEDFKAGGWAALRNAGQWLRDNINTHGVDAAVFGAGILEREEAGIVRGLLGRGTARGEGYVARDFAAGELERHFEKHAIEQAEWGLGNVTRGGYLTRARQLLNSPIGRDIDGFVRRNGDVVRYNIRTNEFAVGARDGTIRTFFRPNDGAAYYLRQQAAR